MSDFESVAQAIKKYEQEKWNELCSEFQRTNSP